MCKYLTKEEFRQSELEMLKQIHDCCQKNSLKYYLAYGTLIGAIRHKGFIPWDDDLDIMMPLDDYYKLRKLFKSDRYFLADCFSNNSHHLPFPRMYDKNTCRDSDPNSLGAFVDIYIIHGAPKDQLKRAKLVVDVMKNTRYAHFFSKWLGILSRHVSKCIFSPIEDLVTARFCRRTFKLLSRYPYQESNVLYAYGGDGMTEFFWKEWFDHNTMRVFEDAEYSVPQYYHDVLSTTYGDYMKLPPIEQQQPYHGSNHMCWKSNIKKK